MKLFSTLIMFLFCGNLFAAQVSFKGWAHVGGEWKIMEIKDNGSTYVRGISFDPGLWKSSKYPVLVIRDERPGKEGQFMTQPILGEEKIIERDIISHGKKVGTVHEKWVYYKHQSGRWIHTMKVCDVGECQDDKAIMGFLAKTSTEDGDYVYSLQLGEETIVLLPEQAERDGNLLTMGVLFMAGALEQLQDFIESIR